MERRDGDGPEVLHGVGAPGGHSDHHPGARADVSVQGQGEGNVYLCHHSLRLNALWLISFLIIFPRFMNLIKTPKCVS